MTRPTTVIGIDPGASGAFALLTPAGLDIADMPVVNAEIDGWAVTRLLAEWGPVDVVVIEKVHSMPGQGVSTTFKFGKNLGVVLGVLAALERPTIHVTPHQWVNSYGLSGRGKASHRLRAMELWPAHAAMFTKSRDGRADAALIARWAAARQLEMS